MKHKRRADGRLQKKVTVNGKYFTTVYGKTAKELDEKYRAKRDAIERGLMVLCNPTVSQYFEAYQNARRGVIKPGSLYNTQSKFSACANVQLADGAYFGDLLLRDVKTAHINTVKTALLERGFNTNSVNQYVGLLKSLFQAAVKERYIDYNPCAPVKNLRRVEEAARDTIHRALTKEEQRIFFADAINSFHYNFFRLAITTGMRHGEISTLRYADIRDGMLLVKRSATRSENGATEIGADAKTQSSTRTIPINPTIAKILADQKQSNTMLWGNVVSGNDLLFRAEGGGVVHNSVLNNAIQRICERQGLIVFSTHAFRATFATEAIEAGVSPRVLMELLGHKNIALTMNLYAHATDGAKQAAMQKLKIIC